jgi:hypothetical protein
VIFDLFGFRAASAGEWLYVDNEVCFEYRFLGVDAFFISQGIQSTFTQIYNLFNFLKKSQFKDTALLVDLDH